jgi:hypothetical protein
MAGADETGRQVCRSKMNTHPHLCGAILSGRAAADRHEPTEVLAMKTERLKEKLAKLTVEMVKLATIEAQMLASPDRQVSFTDPDSRSMATSGRGSGVVGYNVQVAVETEHHLIVAHEVTNSGSDRSQLANMAKQAKAVCKQRNSRPLPIADNSAVRRSCNAPKPVSP